MRIRTHWPLVATLLLLLGGPVFTVQGQEKADRETQNQATSTTPAQTLDDIPPTPKATAPTEVTITAEAGRTPAETAAIMKEILSIRQMFGNLFEGTEVEASVLGESDQPGATARTATTFANELKRAISNTDVQPLGAPSERVRDRRSPENSGITSMLRRMSRELDAQASQLEEQRRYDHADRLRGLAQQVRIQARVFEQPHTPNPITPTFHPYGPPKPIGPATYPSANVPTTSWRVGPKTHPYPIPAGE